MKTRIVLTLLTLSVFSASASQAAENYIFNFTHMLPSPFTLPAGRLVFGTGVELGVTDFFQVGTSLIRDFYKVYNANAEIAMIDTEDFAAALTGGFMHYNYKDISASNPDLTVTSWQPGAVTAFALMPTAALFVGGNLNFSQTNLVTNGIQSSGYVTGATVESDMSWAYNPSTKGKRKSYNVLSVGSTYDVTYKVFGIGISHHWLGFHLGIHYYPNASQYKVMPIIAGGGVVDL